MVEEKEDKDGNFEMSFRVLGNELVGLKIIVDDFKMKWLLMSIFSVLGLTAIASIFGPSIMNMVSK